MSSRWIGAVFVFPLAFVVWSASLVVSVADLRGKLTQDVGLFNDLNDLESAVDGLGKAFCAGEQLVCLEEWEAARDNYATRSAALAAHHLPPEMVGHLAAADCLVAQMALTVERIAREPAPSDGTAALAVSYFSTMHKTADAVAAATALRQRHHGMISGQLSRKWAQLYILVVAACGLSCALCVILLLHARGQAARRQAERVVRESERRFRTLATHSPVGIFLTDADGECTYVNERWCEMAGITPGQALRRGWSQAIHPDDRDQVVHEWLAAARGGRDFARECRFLTPEGKTVWFSAGAVAIKDDAGTVTGFVGTTTDITDRKRLEDLAREHERKLAQTSRLRVMGEMASALAHELKQPLCAISAYVGACLRTLRSAEDQGSGLTKTLPVGDIREPECALSAYSGTCLRTLRTVEGEGPRLTETLAKVEEQARRAGEVIDRIRAFVGKGQLCCAPLDMNDLVRRAVATVRSGLGQSKVGFAFELAEPLPAVHADALQVEHVLLNLIANSVEAMNENRRQGDVVIKMASSDSAILVAVRDSGPGLPPQAAERVFHPFFTTKPDGMGMGLSICRSIVEAHHGRVWASNNADGGATFQFTLPLAQPEPTHDR